MKSPIAPILLEPHLGELPGSSRRISRNDAATGASAAGVRALSAQMVAFYFRAPIKAFFRMRVEYVVSVDRMIFILTISHLVIWYTLPSSTIDEKHNETITSFSYLSFETGICKSCEPPCCRRQVVSAHNNPGIIAPRRSDIRMAVYPESSAPTLAGKCRVRCSQGFGPE
jgi:hypothetical protein